MPDPNARPSDASLKAAIATLEPYRRAVSPLFIGMDKIPDTRPLLFVGNHTLGGVLDVPLMNRELFVEKDIFVRSLGDHFHFDLPLWRDLVTTFGVVDGTRENCARLMKAGECVLVFPGGAREVTKRKGELYKLIWKERRGFARLARAHNCTIVPFSAIGVEDAFDIVLDADDFMKSPAGTIAKYMGWRTDLIPPITRGLAGTPLPRPERFYFRFGDPIDPASFEGDEEDAIWALREATRTAVEQGIEELMTYRDTDPERHLSGRIKRKLLG